MPSLLTSSLLQVQLKVGCWSGSVSPFRPPKYGSLLRTQNNRNAGRFCMFLNKKPMFKDGVLSFNGTEALKGIPDNVVMTPSPWSDSSAFLGVGVASEDSSSRRVFKIGVIKETRLLCLFRFKIWWSIPRVGTSASDVPVETQMLLLEVEATPPEPEPTSYIVFLPILDGETRSSLQGNSADELHVCIETGDTALLASDSLKTVFVNCGSNPFDLMKDSMK